MIESPGFPNSYPNNAYETWILTAPSASIISIKFHYFQVRTIAEYKNRAKYKIISFFSQTENDYDFVTIYDGSNDQSTQIEKLSGNLGSFSISSTGNSMFVKFKSDSYCSALLNTLRQSPSRAKRQLQAGARRGTWLTPPAR